MKLQVSQAVIYLNKYTACLLHCVFQSEELHYVHLYLDSSFLTVNDVNFISVSTMSLIFIWGCNMCSVDLIYFSICLISSIFEGRSLQHFTNISARIKAWGFEMFKAQGLEHVNMNNLRHPHLYCNVCSLSTRTNTLKSMAISKMRHFYMKWNAISQLRTQLQYMIK